MLKQNSKSEATSNHDECRKLTRGFHQHNYQRHTTNYNRCCFHVLSPSEIHVQDPDAQAESGLTATDQRLLLGIFEYKDKS